MMDNKSKEFDVKEIKGEELVDFDTKKSKKKRRFQLKKKHIYLAIGGIVVIMLVITAVTFFKGWFSFDKDRVDLEIIALTEVASGEEIKFVVRYQNNNRVALKDAKLTIDYPRGVYSVYGDELTKETVDLEKIPQKGGGVKDFTIRLVGEKGNIKPIAARLNYKPENKTYWVIPSKEYWEKSIKPIVDNFTLEEIEKHE